MLLSDAIGGGARDACGSGGELRRELLEGLVHERLDVVVELLLLEDGLEDLRLARFDEAEELLLVALQVRDSI
jgi:hypothetical protein